MNKTSKETKKADEEKFNRVVKESFDSGIEKITIHFNNKTRLEAGIDAFLKMIR